MSSPFRVLLVDDSAAMRSFVSATLEAEGTYAVTVATSGFQALKVLPRERFDLIITDINMPDINGLELIRFVRQSAHLRGVALLIISTQSSERDAARALALGADQFLAKPFTPEALREAAVKSLDAARGRRGGAA